MSTSNLDTWLIITNQNLAHQKSPDTLYFDSLQFPVTKNVTFFHSKRKTFIFVTNKKMRTKFGYLHFGGLVCHASAC
jgi:hypothetical protein